MSFINELKRRNVFRVAVAYLAVAWLFTEVSETLFPLFGFGDTPARIVVILLAIGFPLFLIFSWVFEITPEGLKLEKDIRREDSITLRTGKQLDRIIIVILVLALGYFAFDKFVLEPARVVEIVEETTKQTRSEALVDSYGDHSIAVLPFVNLSSDPEQEFFSDGLTEELLNLLSGVPDLRVTARTSSFFFKGKDIPVSEIAKALNVTHVLEGSVRRDGERIRISAQLIEGRSDTHLWSNTYERDLKSIFAIQDEVAGAIAAHLVDSFAGLQIQPNGRANNVAAYEAYRTGRLHWWRRSPHDLDRAIQLFTQATEYDPRFAPAYAAIADSLLVLSAYGNLETQAAIERAQPMIDKALSLDSECAEAFAAQGLARAQIGQFEAAESALRHAINLNGDYMPARLWLTALLGDTGRIPEQALALKEAMVLDPLNELLAINYAGNLFAQGDSEDAVGVLSDLLQMRPDSTMLLLTLADFFQESGDLVKGWEYATQSFNLEPDSPVVITTMAKAWMGIGYIDESEKLLRAGIEQASDNAELKNLYFNVLLFDYRLEEAEQLVKEQIGRDIKLLPVRFQRTYHQQMGLIQIRREYWASAKESMELAINPNPTKSFNRYQFLTLTMAALLNHRLGDLDRAGLQLEEAGRGVYYALLNRVDDASIHYSMAVLHSLQGDKEQAFAELHKAYAKGFRDYLLLNNDVRFDAVRNNPTFHAIQHQIADDIKKAQIEILALYTTTNT